MAGFDRPSAGSVVVAGTDVAALGSWAAGAFRSRTIGYADQHYWRALAGELTARELVGVQLGLAGVARGEARGARGRAARAGRALGRAGTRIRASSPAASSSGSRSARRSRGGRELLIADEPTGELDAATAASVLELLAELRRTRVERRSSSATTRLRPSVADRVVHIRDGRVSDERLAGDGRHLVVGRGGWLRVPEDILRAAGHRRSATRS